MGSVVVLVFCKTAGADSGVYLDSWHAAAIADGPAHEFRVEIHAADGAHQHRYRGHLVLHASGLPTLAGGCGDGFWALHPAWSRLDGGEETGEAHV